MDNNTRDNNTENKKSAVVQRYRIPINNSEGDRADGANSGVIIRKSPSGNRKTSGTKRRQSASAGSNRRTAARTGSRRMTDNDRRTGEGVSRRSAETGRRASNTESVATRGGSSRRTSAGRNAAAGRNPGRPLHESVQSERKSGSGRKPKQNKPQKGNIKEKALELFAKAKAHAIANPKIWIAGAGVVLIVFILLIAIIGGSGDSGKSVAATADEPQAVAEPTPTPIPTQLVTGDDVLMLSFSTLIAGSDWIPEGTTAMTADDFKQILQALYDQNYVLVDFYSLTKQETDEEGKAVYSLNEECEVPEGKKPLVLTQRNVSYPFEQMGCGYPNRLVLDANGNITCEITASDDSIVTGAYDVVPILEDFIAVHPDFSYNNARAVIGLTGKYGVLGYRTTSTLGLSQAEGNEFEKYGVFDTAAEKASAEALIANMKNRGYHFACNSFGDYSYGSSVDLIQKDYEKWLQEVSTLIGGTDILILPQSADIGPWSGYTDDNEKNSYLKGQGFRFYCLEEEANREWMQVRADYVRAGMHYVTSYADFEEVMAMDADNASYMASHPQTQTASTLPNTGQKKTATADEPSESVQDENTQEESESEDYSDDDEEHEESNDYSDQEYSEDSDSDSY